MPRLAANLSLLFAERPMLERVQAAASAGFAGVEVQFPYAHSAQEWRDALTSAQIPLILHNLPAGNWMAGERGIATDPKREAEFQGGVLQARAFAQELGDCFPTRQLNCIVGLTPQDTDPIDVHKTLIRNLRYAAEKLGEAGFKLLIEPLNLRDVPHFYLSSTAHAKALIDEVARPNLADTFVAKQTFKQSIALSWPYTNCRHTGSP
jgi:hydroxypyruvate isomerase